VPDEQQGRGGIVVEFYGMPAAGKTYTAQQLADALAQSDIVVDADTLCIAQLGRVRWVRYKLGMGALAVLRKPGLCYSAYLLVKASRPIALSNFIRIYFNWLYIIGIVTQRGSQGKVLLLDQGIAQAIWSTAYFARIRLRFPYYDFLAKLQRRLGIDLITIRKEADTATIQSRLRSRPDNRSPFDQERDGDMNKAVTVTDELEVLLSEGAESGFLNAHLAIWGDSATRDDIASIVTAAACAKQ
jgi:hypothetical protein